MGIVSLLDPLSSGGLRGYNFGYFHFGFIHHYKPGTKVKHWKYSSLRFNWNSYRFFHFHVLLVCWLQFLGPLPERCLTSVVSTLIISHWLWISTTSKRKKKSKQACFSLHSRPLRAEGANSSCRWEFLCQIVFIHQHARRGPENVTSDEVRHKTPSARFLRNFVWLCLWLWQAG